jgi:small-conductance mechanosensitive channel
MTGLINLTETQLEALRTIVWLVIAIVAGTSAHRLMSWILRRWAERRKSAFLAALIRRTNRPAAYIVPLLAILAVVPNIDIPPAWQATMVHFTGLATIAAVAWTIIAAIRLWVDITLARHQIDAEDNLLARQLGTRVDILARVFITLVSIVALGAMLMTFPPIRAFGTTLLASAGLAGVVVGLAARPLFENLFAGIQLALTQPIRLDDVVIVEKQYGRIEEIHATYVVVRLWDLRRMVVPLTYFINTPFENWTRRTANLLGEVFVFADWSVDVDALRAELPRIVERTPLWDKQVQVVHVTDATERAVQIRALVSARNSPELFDLRCYVREALIAYLRDHQPGALPRERQLLTELGDEDDGEKSGEKRDGAGNRGEKSPPDGATARARVGDGDVTPAADADVTTRAHVVDGDVTLPVKER